MEALSFLELSSYAGLLATGVLTLNFLLGMMISTGYTRLAYWKRLPDKIQKWDLLNIHNWTAYAALVLVFVHPLLLLFDPRTKFFIIDIFYPVNAPHEKWMVAFGTISMYALVVVIITTQKVIKRSMGFRTWKNIHLISYGTALLFLVHGMIIDPKLKDRPVDLVDAEKMVPEGCMLLIIIASAIRYGHYLRNKKNKLKLY
jgi:DMSO/TMAO reductase YedYZ heme-binding membrane subunit